MTIGIGFEPGLITAVDSDGELLTRVERLDYLYKTGFRFEAAVSQMVLVEALLFAYFKARIQADRIDIKEDFDSLWKSRRLTFGKVKKMVLDNNILHDKSIASGLIEYVNHRNELAHKLVLMIRRVDFEHFYGLGQTLISFFHEYLLEVASRTDGQQPPLEK